MGTVCLIIKTFGLRDQLHLFKREIIGRGRRFLRKWQPISFIFRVANKKTRQKQKKTKTQV